MEEVGRAAGEAVDRQCPQGRRASRCDHAGAQAVARPAPSGVLISPMAELEEKPLAVALGIESLRRSRMDRFIDGIEPIAALFVGIVAADIFTSVLLRY